MQKCCTTIQAPLSIPPIEQIKKCIDIWKKSSKILVIIGKGAQYSCVDTILNKFVQENNIFFLPMGMAKGLLPDDHPLCVSAARSIVLNSSDFVLLVCILYISLCYSILYI